MAEQDIDDLVNQVPPGGTLTLSPPKREFEGPVTIRKPLTLVGQQGLIWGKKGPVLRIECSGVVLQDLSVEVTGREENLTGQEACAVVVAPGQGLTLNDVYVRGNVTGLPEEEGNWRYPRSIRMKAPPNQKQEFHTKFTVPVPCRLVSHIAGVRVEPSSLRAGETDVRLVLDPLAPGVRVRGEISLNTAFLIRQIAVIANVSASASEADRFQVAFWDSLSAGPAAVPTPAAAQESAATVPAPAPTRRPARKPRQKVQDTAERLGPGSTPAQKPIPEKLEQEREPVKATGPHVPDVFGKEDAAPSLTVASKIKSVPLDNMWSPLVDKTAKEEPSPALPEVPQQKTVVANQEMHAEPASPDAPVTNAGVGTSKSMEADAGAALRKCPMLDFTAFQAQQASAASQPGSTAQNKEDENKRAVCGPAQEDEDKETEEANSESRSSEPEAPKSRKLRKTNGNLGAFGGGRE